MRFDRPRMTAPGLLTAVLYGCVLAAAFSSGNAAAVPWNVQPAAWKLAADIHGLHEWVVVLVTFIFVGVFGFMFWSIYAHRKSVGRKAANFHEHIGVEIAWTVIPLIIVVIIAWPVAKTVIALKDTTNADITVKVSGLKWQWGYDYLKGEGGWKPVPSPGSSVNGRGSGFEPMIKFGATPT